MAVAQGGRRVLSCRRPMQLGRRNASNFIACPLRGRPAVERRIPTAVLGGMPNRVAVAPSGFVTWRWLALAGGPAVDVVVGNVFLDYRSRLRSRVDSRDARAALSWLVLGSRAGCAGLAWSSRGGRAGVPSWVRVALARCPVQGSRESGAVSRPGSAGPPKDSRAVHRAVGELARRLRGARAGTS